MRTITKLRRNSKALSPIFATLILIAIAVIAGIVVYMFTSGTIAGLTSGGTAGQEKAAVQGVQVATGGKITVFAQYVSGGSDIVINGAIVRDANGGQIVGIVTQASASPSPVYPTLTTDGLLKSIEVTGVTLVTGHSYSVTLTSSKGGSFVSAAFSGVTAPVTP